MNWDQVAAAAGWHGPAPHGLGRHLGACRSSRRPDAASITNNGVPPPPSTPAEAATAASAAGAAADAAASSGAPASHVSWWRNMQNSLNKQANVMAERFSRTTADLRTAQGKFKAPDLKAFRGLGVKVEMDILNPAINTAKTYWAALPEPVREVAPFVGVSVATSMVMSRVYGEQVRLARSHYAQLKEEHEQALQANKELEEQVGLLESKVRRGSVDMDIGMAGALAQVTQAAAQAASAAATAASACAYPSSVSAQAFASQQRQQQLEEQRGRERKADEYERQRQAQQQRRRQLQRRQQQQARPALLAGPGYGALSTAGAGGDGVEVPPEVGGDGDQQPPQQPPPATQGFHWPTIGVPFSKRQAGKRD